MPKNNVSQLGDRGKGLDPRTMMEKILRDVEDIDQVAVVIRHKDGDSSMYCTSGDRSFWWQCSYQLADVAMHGEDL